MLAAAGYTLPFALAARAPARGRDASWSRSVVTESALLTDATRYFIPFIAVMLFSYGGGAYARRPARPTPRLAIMVAGVLTVTLLSPSQIVGDYIFPTAFAAISWLAGRAVRTRTRLTEELHEAAVREQEARELEAQRAAADERRRIAREMHDVVAHSVSVMVVQAGGARRILERDPERAVAAAAQIERTGPRGARRDAAAARRAAPRRRRARRARPAADDGGRRARSSSGRGRPACRSSCTSRASGARCPPGSTSPRSASCRRG